MDGSQQGLWLLQALDEGQIMEKFISLKERQAVCLAAGIDGWGSDTLFNKETERKKIKESTWSVLTDRAPRDPNHATLLAPPHVALPQAVCRMELMVLHLLADNPTISPSSSGSCW